MKFKKLSENSIRCIISKEEMYEYGVDIDDLMDDRDKAEDFLRYIMQQARYELDFKTSGEALSVQLSVMPRGDLALIVSDNKGETFKEVLGQLKDKLEQFKDSMNSVATQDIQKALEQTMEDNKETDTALKGNPSGENKRHILPTYINEPLWICLASMDDVISLAQKLEKIPKTHSQLYRYKDSYYLRLNLSQNADYISYMFLAISEYAKLTILESHGALSVMEHGKLLLKEDAIQTLANL